MLWVRVTLAAPDTTSLMMRHITPALLALLLAACDRSGASPPPALNDVGPEMVEAPRPTPAPATTAAPEPTVAAATPKRPLDVASYPWHGDESIEPLPAVDHLDQRFAPPQGYRRVDVAPGSFGAWLRTLPLAAVGTPVLAHDGETILPADHRHLAAVTTLDTGKRDLQQCADAVMRLSAEWRWSRSEARGVSFDSGFGPIAWTRFLGGEAPHYDGKRVTWRRSKRVFRDDHRSFRRYLDVVFTWANTGSLAGQGARPEPNELRPGDFFVLPGAPGHTVLVLDLATDREGRRVALVGQSFMPAQRFQVLRPSRDRTWFTVGEEGVDTPFWRRFPWSSLRRLDNG